MNSQEKGLTQMLDVFSAWALEALTALINTITLPIRLVIGLLE